ncbi:ribosome biogenesis GTPase Der [Candidatus Saccharibacteria bacterium]|nr:ribosome biogenesis GTPase Der [Candidatus Saccharibacteria bacterium]
MNRLPIVALIGQTNAGKSSLLNRLAKKKIAIVAREEGTTRDSVSAKTDDRFLLIDTAGLLDPRDAFEASIQDQIADAVETADLLLLTLDSSLYPSEKDKKIAKMALKSKKPVFLVLNKSDLGASLPASEFLSLGIKEKDTFRTSATTGQGIKELKDSIVAQIHSISKHKESKIAKQFLSDGGARSESGCGCGVPTPDADTARNAKKLNEFDSHLTISLIGRPNVGKSSLFNSLGKKQQALVSSRQGTTRDVNRLELRYKSTSLEILDTAGLRKPGKREVGIEKFSALRTLAAIEESDVCALLIDSTEPHSKLDQSLAGEIVKAGKGIVVVLTKTDLKSSEEIDQILSDLEYDFNFLPFAPVLLTSSLTGENVTKLFDLALEISESRKLEIKTSELNKILADCILEHAPAGLKNTRPKPKYIVQTDTCPPWFVVHGHGLSTLHWSWKRFLENKLREKYPFVGTPIFFSFRDDKSSKSE